MRRDDEFFAAALAKPGCLSTMVAVSWRIESGPHPAPWDGRDAVGWVWLLENEAGETRGIRVDVSGTAMAVASEHLPDETVQARETHGRSEVELVLDTDEPPRRIALTTVGRAAGEGADEAGWWVLLRGDAPDLALLVESFDGERLEVTQREGETYLRSEEFRDAADEADVLSRAAELVREANGAARLLDSNFRSVQVDRVVLVDESGARRHFLNLEGGIRGVGGVSAELTVTRADGTEREPLEPEPPPANRWVSLAGSAPNVARALRLLGNPEPSWSELYHVLDIVQEDVGGRMFDDAWVERADINLFTHTANNARAIGEQARHGHTQWEPPANPMTIDAARSLLQRLVRRWLDAQ